MELKILSAMQTAICLVMYTEWSQFWCNFKAFDRPILIQFTRKFFPDILYNQITILT